MNQNVDTYLAEGCYRCNLGGTPQCKVHKWNDELILLRKILLDCGLTEEIKWSFPCYTNHGKNIVMLSAFKEYASVSFFKGSLLNDAEHLLDKPGENSQSSRQFRFKDVENIIKLEATIKAYVFEAIEVEKAGLKVASKPVEEYDMPDELQQQFDSLPKLKEAFYALTPGRQKGYLLYFSQAKQAKTRISRIEKFIPKILQGKGFND